jgi:hypothetical protein
MQMGSIEGDIHDLVYVMIDEVPLSPIDAQISRENFARKIFAKMSSPGVEITH